MRLPDPSQSIGLLSEQTVKNVRRAKAWGRQWKTVSVVWKFWTEYTRFWPDVSDEILDWWERREVFKVRQIKVYWLRFGVSVYWPVKGDPHEDAYRKL